MYQPKVLAQTRRIESVEALLRWEHPVLGVVAPDRFIVVAETAGMMDELTRWVLGEALDAEVRWRDSGVDVAVAVNLSAQSVGDYGLLGWIDDQLRLRGLAPSCLTVEITETAVMADPEVATRFLAALRALGMRVSVDDFGTGYTSLSVLARLPLDELKIDQSFIRRSATSTADEAVIRSVRELGHRLGLDVVAEGVEDEATARRLTEFGVDVLQGYFFSEPLTETALAGFVAADRGAGHETSGPLDERAEADRITALYRYGILDSETDAGLDDITALAAHICNTPIALVSLVDVDRQHFAARVGLGVTETPRSDSFCAHALTGVDLLEVADAQADERFAHNPLVTGDPNVRFYAGAPLRTPDGHTLGSLCVIDRKPRHLTNAQRRALASLSRTVMRQLETRRVALAAGRLPDQLRQMLTARTHGHPQQAETVHLGMCAELLLCDFVMILRRTRRDSPYFTPSNCLADPARTKIIDTLAIDSTATNSLATAIEHRTAVFVPDVTTSPLTDRHTSRLLDVRAVHVQPVIRPDNTIDSVIVTGWEHSTDNLNRTAIEFLAVTATVLGMTPPSTAAAVSETN